MWGDMRKYAVKPSIHVTASPSTVASAFTSLASRSCGWHQNSITDIAALSADVGVLCSLCRVCVSENNGAGWNFKRSPAHCLHLFLHALLMQAVQMMCLYWLLLSSSIHAQSLLQLATLLLLHHAWLSL